MTLYEKIKQLYPSLTDDDFAPDTAQLCYKMIAMAEVTTLNLGNTQH